MFFKRLNGKCQLTKERPASGLVIIGMVLLVSACSDKTSHPGITKKDILNVLLRQEGQINDLSFSFTMEEIIKDKGVVSRQHTKVSLSTKEDLFRTRMQTFLYEDGEKKLTWDTEISADGIAVYYLDRMGRATRTEKKLPSEAGIRQNWGWAYLSPTLRKPRRRGNKGYEGNLIAALEEDYSNIKLLDKMVLFEGRNTVVLERPGYCRVYLDPKIGFAVIGIESDEENLLKFRYVNSEFKEVAEGFWLPMRVEHSQSGKLKPGLSCSIKRQKSEDLIIEDFELKRKLEIIDLKVNSGLTVEDFKIIGLTWEDFKTEFPE